MCGGEGGLTPAAATGDMMPFDIPLWYFVLCELGFIALITACTLYLKMHKLFLRL